MKIYKGIRPEEGDYASDNSVTVNGENFEWLMLQKSLNLRNHSPTGFNWGYGGSGPHQLALALLLDATGDENTAETFHHYFTIEFVSGWDNTWEMTDTAIKTWVEAKKAGLN